MAHECPECWRTCYCGKDIDDCLFNRDEDVNRCTHCPVDCQPKDDEYDEEIE